VNPVHSREDPLPSPPRGRPNDAHSRPRA
jgi:hypothetical protein